MSIAKPATIDANQPVDLWRGSEPRHTAWRNIPRRTIVTQKKSDDVFSPAALAPSLRTSNTTGTLAFERSRALTKAERKSNDEYHKQVLVIAEQEQKTREAQRAVGSLRVSAVQAFAETAETVWAVKSAAGRDADVQRYVDHFCDQSVRAAGTHIHEATNVGSERILDEVGRSLYVPTEEERRGFWARLVQGNE
jgi:hypothetical protein